MTPTLDDLIGGDPGVAQACREIERDEDDAEADRLFGVTIRQVIAAEHGPQVAAAIRDAFTKATRPGTPDRVRQNRLHAIMTARLGKLVGDGL